MKRKLFLTILQCKLCSSALQLKGEPGFFLIVLHNALEKAVKQVQGNSSYSPVPNNREGLNKRGGGGVGVGGSDR